LNAWNCWAKYTSLTQGGFAQCYKVTDGAKLFAAKVVHKPSLKSSKQRQKLLSEIKIHQTMSHPNIVMFYSCFEDEENVYMILELCDNKTLVDMIKNRKRLSEDEARFYMFQLFDGIRYMHRKGFIHRDIKLGNLFLDGNMNLKIGDFGLAAEIEHDGQRKKTICGTPNYIAPEILFDTQNGHSFEVDIWSLGVVMYTLLIGKPPFQTRDVKAIYKNIRDNCYDFPDTVEISEVAKQCIQALLNSKPEERPSIDDIMDHAFFKTVRPRKIPIEALERIPTRSEMELADEKEPVIENVIDQFQQPTSSRHNVQWASPPRKDGVADLEHRSPFAIPEPRDRFVKSKLDGEMYRATAPPLPPTLPSPRVNRHMSPKRLPIPLERRVSPELVTRSPLSVRSQNQLQEDAKVASPLSKESSPEKRKRTHLELFYVTLKRGLSRESTLESRLAALSTEHLSPPDVFITRWVDYSNKYGLSYQFRDGSIGVYFNDGTSIILSADGKYIQVM
jgi:serine/threonine protein kinase